MQHNSQQRYLKDPGLPEHPVCVVVVSGVFQKFHEIFLSLGIDVIPSNRISSLQSPVAHHPDMQLCNLGCGHMFALKGNGGYYKSKLCDETILETELRVKNHYPQDILCNCVRIGKYLFGKLKSIDPLILKCAESLGLNFVNVNQGYTACSSCIIHESALITEDSSIARAATAVGIDVLKIKPNAISLPGYDTGFIGGCAGKIDRHLIAFTGSLKNHPSGDDILKFLKKYKLNFIELSEEPLIDIGGIIPIKETIIIRGVPN